LALWVDFSLIGSDTNATLLLAGIVIVLDSIWEDVLKTNFFDYSAGEN